LTHKHKKDAHLHFYASFFIIEVKAKYTLNVVLSICCRDIKHKTCSINSESRTLYICKFIFWHEPFQYSKTKPANSKRFFILNQEQEQIKEVIISVTYPGDHIGLSVSRCNVE
jgi:hypothetical protein